MKSIRYVALAAVSGLLLTSAPTGATVLTVGALSNFDAYCGVTDTDYKGIIIPACNGFEIDLEDTHSTDISHVYSNPHYGAPEISEESYTGTDGMAHYRARIRYRAVWNGTVWSVHTPNTKYLPPTNIYGCSTANGCDHFGVVSTRLPSKVIYNWLVPQLDPATNTPTGALDVSTTLVPIPPPIFTVQLPPATAAIQQPVVQEAIEAPEPPPFQEFGDAQWVKSFKRQSARQLRLDNMMTGDPSIPDGSNPAEVEVEWQLIQRANPNPNWCLDANPPLALPCPQQATATPEGLQGSDQIAPGNSSIVRRYEFYEYIGPYDAQTHEATPFGNVSPPGGQAPDPRDLGNYQGSQMAGANIITPLATNPQTPMGEIGVAYPSTTLTSGGLQPYVVNIVDGVLPTGLSIDDAGVLSGVPTDTGTTPVIVDFMDANGDVVQDTFNLTIVDAVSITTTALPDGNVGVPFNANLQAIGGVAPLAWTAMGALPPGLAIDTTGTVFGTPTTAGAWTIAAYVGDPLGGRANQNVSVNVAPASVACTAWSGAKSEGKSTISAVGPGYISVSGKTIRYNNCTSIKLNDVTGIAEGLPVQYKAYKNSNGDITASYLEIN